MENSLNKNKNEKNTVRISFIYIFDGSPEGGGVLANRGAMQEGQEA